MITHEEVLRIVHEAAAAGECPAYIPAFDGNALQLGLEDLPSVETTRSRVLDVGCNVGLRCFQAAEAGAAKVVGIDANPARVVQARAVARRIGAEVRFDCLDADHDVLPTGFDTVFTCGVLHRSRNPFALIDRLAAICEDTLVIESEGPGQASVGPYLLGLGVRDWLRTRAAPLPIVLVGRGGPTPPVPEARFYPTATALQTYLSLHRVDFAVSEPSATPGRNRFAVTGRRRRIRHLTIVAGASGVGKSTFMDHLATGRLDAKFERVGLPALGRCPTLTASDVHRLPAEVDRIIIHYDMNRAARWPSKNFETDEAIMLLDIAERGSILTLWADPETLTARKQDRIASLTGSNDRGGRLLKAIRHGVRAARTGSIERVDMARRLRRQHWDIDFFATPGSVARLYEQWFSASRISRVSEHWILDTTTTDYNLSRPAEWPANRA